MTADATFVTKQFYVNDHSHNLSTPQSQRFSIFGSQFLGEKQLESNNILPCGLLRTWIMINIVVLEGMITFTLGFS